MEDKDFQKRLEAVDKLLLVKFNYKTQRWEIYRMEKRVYPVNSPSCRKAGIVLYATEDYPRFILRIENQGKYREPAEDIIHELQRMDSWRRLRPTLDFLVDLRKAEIEEERQKEKIWEM
ncbi:MAG: hypothetical protein DDT19_00244 [Syntrophomonadaceae bacterium]|nr:hypothetical protein [Bacillota bacterium]